MKIKFTTLNMLLVSTCLVLSTVSIVKATPCDSDIEEFCGNIQAGSGNLGSCLERNMDELKYSCRSWLKKADKALKAAASACSSSVREFCRDETPGYDRLRTCLMDQLDKLPTDCRDILEGTTHAPAPAAAPVTGSTTH